MATVDIYYKIENGVLSLRNDSTSGYTLFSCPNDSGDDEPNFPWKSNTNITTITIDNDIILPKSCYELFSGMTKLITINNILRLNTSNVTNMSSMFNYCQKLTSLDLSNFNTSNVTDMSNMFSGCIALTSLDLSNFNTSKITDMSFMFFDCQTLTSLDLSNFDTSKVITMRYMFYHCSLLITIYASQNFKTTNVNNNSYNNSYNMFYECTNLVGGKNTIYNSSYVDKTYAHIDEGISNPGYFTYKCLCAEFDSTDGTLRIFSSTTEYTNGQTIGTKTYYTEIDQITGVANPKWYSIRNSIIKIVIEDLFIPKTGYHLFSSNSLTSIEFFKYNVVVNPSITNINLYYEYDSETETYFLTEDQTIEEKTYYTKFSIFDTSNVTNMSDMFSHCQELTSLDVSNFNTSNVTNMSDMFLNCRALTSLDLLNFDTSNVTDMSGMFFNCFLLTSLDVSNFNTSNVTNMNDMFLSCRALTSLDLLNFDTSNVTDMSSMFYHCRALTSLDISNFVFLNNVIINNMFRDCTSLTGAIRINSNPSSYTNMFKDTVKEIVLFGNSTLLNSFATTANNHNVYVWTLTAQPTANRDDNVGISVNLSVKIQSYAISNDNVIQAIKVYEGDSTNPLTLTWDKSFAINENPKTFTTTITGIDENTTVTYRIQVEDNYGVSSFREVIVPTNYYTIDFLKGGKEISFGEKADIDDFYEVLTTIPDDWVDNYHNYYKKEGDEYSPNTDENFVSGNYYKKTHESLFKCGMDAVFLTETQLFKSMYDIMHPIGSYYESSLTYIPPSQINELTPILDSPTSEDLKVLGITWFNPNFIWSGTWELELAGQVHVSSGTGYAVNGAESNTSDGGSKYLQAHTHSDSFTLPNHVHGTGGSAANDTDRFLLGSSDNNGGIARRTINNGTGASLVGNYYNENHTISRKQNTGDPTTNPSLSGSVGAVSGVSTGQSDNMPPYIIVNRWHRIA